MKNFIIEKVPKIFLMSLLAGTIVQMAVDFGGYDMKGFGLLICAFLFTFTGIICYATEPENESDKNIKNYIIKQERIKDEKQN